MMRARTGGGIRHLERKGQHRHLYVPAQEALIVACEKIKDRREAGQKSEPACRDNDGIAQRPLLQQEVKQQGRTHEREVELRRCGKACGRADGEPAPARRTRRLGERHRGRQAQQRDRVIPDLFAVGNDEKIGEAQGGVECT